MDLPLHVIALVVQSFTPQEVLQFLAVVKRFAQNKTFLCNKVQTFRSHDDDALQLIEFTKHAQSFPALTSLDLSCKCITDEQVINVVSKYTTLKHIHLANCDIKGPLLNTLAETNNFLETLDVANCHSLCEFAFLSLVEQCPNLKHVNLKGCRHITHWGLMALADFCPKLKWLNVNSCDDITDTGLSSIGLCCSYLEHLDVGDCSEITPHCIQNVVSNCTQLQYLNVAHYCSDFENNPIAGLERIPHVVK